MRLATEGSDVTQSIALDPVMVPLPQAPGRFGISRSAIYRGAAAGHIVLKKLGRTTLVDSASVRDYLAALPGFTPKLHS